MKVKTQTSSAHSFPIQTLPPVELAVVMQLSLLMGLLGRTQ
jgi:hypothetical protein